MAIINSTELMYRTFLACRVRALNVAVRLPRLNSVLQRVREARALDVRVEEGWLDEVFGESAQQMRAHGGLEPGGELNLVHDNERFFDLVDIAQAHMTALCARDAWNAVGNLGYALHNMPHFIRHPRSFDADWFQFCFRIAAFNWDEHPHDLQLALCATIGINPAMAARLVRSKGFAINNSRAEPVPFSEVKVVEEWIDTQKKRRS